MRSAAFLPASVISCLVFSQSYTVSTFAGGALTSNETRAMVLLLALDEFVLRVYRALHIENGSSHASVRQRVVTSSPIDFRCRPI
jgi:hypothetical protein